MVPQSAKYRPIWSHWLKRQLAWRKVQARTFSSSQLHTSLYFGPHLHTLHGARLKTLNSRKVIFWSKSGSPTQCDKMAHLQFAQKFTIYKRKIRTRIVRIEGEHADHLTTTTAHHQITLFLDRLKYQHLRRREGFHEKSF